MIPEVWKVAAAILGTSAASVLGTFAIKAGVVHGSAWLAILGSTLWSLSGASFAFAASRNIELSVLAGVTSAFALLLTTLIATLWLGDGMNSGRTVAVTMICAAIVLLALPVRPG